MKKENDYNNFYHYIKSINIVGGFVLFVIGEIFLYISTAIIKEKDVVNNILNDANIIYINISLILLMMFIFWLLEGYLKNRFENVKEREKAVNNKLKISNEDRTINKGELYFNLALGLNNYEPQKIDYLVKALNERYALAGIYLGNLYCTGLEKNERILLKKDYEEAYECYSRICDIDDTGVAYWHMGWMYEKQGKDKDLPEIEREKKALELYKLSAEKNYPKAYNSIAKFYVYGKAGLNKDLFQAITNYDKAKSLGDTNAILNCAYTYTDSKQFDLADENYLEAIKSGSPLANFKYGEFIIKYGTQLSFPKFPKYANTYFINAATGITIYAALSNYYLYRYYDDLKCIKKSEKYASESVRIFDELIKNGFRLQGEALRIYEELK